MRFVEGALLLLAAQQPAEKWLGGQRPDIVLTRDTAIFAAPRMVGERQLGKKAALDDLYARVGPRLKDLGIEMVRSDETLIGWQDPNDGERRGQIRLSPMGDFVGIILVSPARPSPGRHSSSREQPETCTALVARIESYYGRRFGPPDPCGEPGPKATDDGGPSARGSGGSSQGSSVGREWDAAALDDINKVIAAALSLSLIDGRWDGATLVRILGDLRMKGLVECHGRGPGARWRKRGTTLKRG